MSAWPPKADTSHKGKMQTKPSLTRVGQATQKSHLKSRMKADDSAAVLMSDQKLGSGIRT